MQYPLLITRLQDPYNPIGDVYRAEYAQAASVAEDRLDGFVPVSTFPTADEEAAGWTPSGAALLRMDDRIVEKRPSQLGTVWTRDELSDCAMVPEALYYTSEGVLFRLAKPGGRAQKVEVPAPLLGGLEAGPNGLLLQTDRGLARFDPETGQGAEVALGDFQDFCLAPDGNSIVYTTEGALRLRELSSGADRLLLAASGEMRSAPRFSPDQSRVFFSSWHIGADLAVRSRLQVMENRPGAVPRTLLENVLGACPGVPSSEGERPGL